MNEPHVSATAASGDSPVETSQYTLHLFSPKRHDICLITPVLNEGERIRRQLLAMQPYKEMVDIIIADGGSKDHSLALDYVRDKVRGLMVCKHCPSRLSSQYGHAMQYALDEGYQGIIMVDGNGKDGMDAIPGFVRALKDGYDMVQGSRFMKGGRHENTPIDRLWGTRLIFNPIMWVGSGYLYSDAINGFKAVSRRYLLDERLQPFHDRYYCYGLQYHLNCAARKLGYRVTEVPVARLYPKSEPTPTKIHGLRGRVLVVWELLKVITGCYRAPRK